MCFASWGWVSEEGHLTPTLLYPQLRVREGDPERVNQEERKEEEFTGSRSLSALEMIFGGLGGIGGSAASLGE
jgi:hypothetical protein